MAGLNARNVLRNIENCIEELEERQGRWTLDRRYIEVGYTAKYKFRIRAVCNELSIFDWWNEGLSLTQLKQMRTFVQTAIKLGFTGYVCFKVGAAGCANGMWAYKKESTTGYSPDGDCLYHSFVSSYSYYDICLNNEWARKQMKLAQVKVALA